MKAWWAGLNRRERMTVGIGVYVVALIIVWFGIVRPLDTDNARLRAGVAVEGNDYAWMRHAAAQVLRLRAPRSDSNHAATSQGTTAHGGQSGSLLAQLNASLTGANLAASLQSMRPDGDNKVYIVLKGCAYTSLSKWLALLTRSGINVAEAQLDRRGPDDVDARLSLKRRGG